MDTLSSADLKRLVMGEFRLTTFPLAWPRLRKRFEEYDVINLHGPVPSLSDAYLLFNRLVSRSRRTPLVYTHHCAIEIDGLSKACDVYNGVHRWLSQSADACITTSRYYRDVLFSAKDQDIHVVPWGADPVMPAQRSHRESGRPLKVLFVGQMRPYKGVDYLLDAVAGVPEVHLTLVGGGPLLATYRDRVAAMGVQNIEFLGRISDEELEQAYAAHEVICLPSVTRAEAFGMVVLEGMSLGLVPVVTDLPGVRDVVADAGPVVSTRSRVQLRQVLVELARDPQRMAGLRQAALERARELSWENCVQRYDAILRSVVDTGTSGQPKDQVEVPGLEPDLVIDLRDGVRQPIPAGAQT